MTRPIPDIFSSKPRLNVTCLAPIVLEKMLPTTWTLNYSGRFWTKHQSMDRDHSLCICSANPCCILEFLTQLSTSSGKIKGTEYYLPRMEHTSTSSLMNSFDCELTVSYGHGGKKRDSNQRLLKSSRDGVSFSYASLLKRLRKKSTRGGKNGNQ